MKYKRDLHVTFNC